MSTKLLVIRRAKTLEGERNVLRSQSIKAARTKAPNRVCVSVAVVRAIAQKILHVLQSENNVGTVESKDTLLEFAKVRRKELKKEQGQGMFRAQEWTSVCDYRT